MSGWSLPRKKVCKDADIVSDTQSNIITTIIPEVIICVSCSHVPNKNISHFFANNCGTEKMCIMQNRRN